MYNTLSTQFHFIDWAIIGLYFIGLIWLSRRKAGDDTSEAGYLLSGRSLSLPAFVATLVSTWYGGILGVGEFSFQFGVSQWFLFGFPFYVFALLFAWFLAGKIRENKALTIPESIANSYGKPASRISALWIFILVSPAPYILMLGMLLQFVVGGESNIILYSTLIAFFSAAYVSYNGFKSVVRTDVLQVLLMYGGFGLLIFYSISEFGGIAQLWDNLPSAHKDPTGGHSFQFIMVWFFIALWTFVDPGFHQRAAAAKSSGTARKGIVISIGFWFVFDMLTLLAGLYGFVHFADISNPALVYPLMADTLLPAGLKGLFFLALLATIMSTLDSFLFLSGQTLGRDFVESSKTRFSSIQQIQMGIFISAALGIILTIVFPSIISLWYVIGSVMIPGLLIPVIGVHLPIFRLRKAFILPSLLIPTLIALIWLIAGMVQSSELYDYTFLGIEPFYPGLFSGIILWLVSRYLSVNNPEKLNL